MQRPLRIARGPEVGARGAALAAARALGLDVDAAAWTRSDDWVEPDPAAADFAAERFARYRADARRRARPLVVAGARERRGALTTHAPPATEIDCFQLTTGRRAV